MNFALLGDDPGLLPLLEEIAKAPGRQLRHAALLTSPQEVLSLAPSLRLHDEAGALLSASDVDAVIVAGSDEAVLEPARQLAAAGFPLLVAPRGGPHSTLVYELQLIRDDTGAVLRPVLLHRFHPLMQRARDVLQAGDLGKVLHVKLQRRQAAVESEQPVALLSRGDVDEALLRDVDLLRCLAGDFGRVTALYSTGEADRISLATVTFSDDQGAEMIWSLQPGDESSWRLEVTGEAGVLVLSGGDDPNSWRLEKGGGTISLDGDEAGQQTYQGLLANLEAAIGGANDPPTWQDLIRACDVVDAARRSLARRRTIDLNHAATSERSIFKSQMSAAGCLVLAVTLLGLVGLLAFASVLDPRDRQEKRSTAAGFVVYASEFRPGGAALSAGGRQRLDNIALRMPDVPHTIVVEHDDDAPPQLNAQRREAVVDQLNELQSADADARTRLAPLTGKWLAQFRKIGVAIVFLPLAIFLGLQLLLFITRPSVDDKPS